MSIEELVRKPVQTLPMTATCIEAARVMSVENVGSIVVATNGTPDGIVTDRDLVTRVMAHGGDPATTQLGDVMSRYTAFVSIRRSLDEAIATMRDMGVRRVPVVKEGGDLLGIISMDDVLIALARQLAGIAAAIQRELGNVEAASAPSPLDARSETP